MNHRSKLKRIGVLILVSLFFLIGIGSAVVASEKIELTFWYAGPKYGATYEKIAQSFYEKFPNIKINFYNQDPTRLAAKLVASFLTETNPDLISDGPTRVFDVEIKYQVWEDMNPWIEKDPELAAIVSKLDKSAMEITKMGEKQWGLPSAKMLVSLFARKSWLEKFGFNLPKDWNEMLEIADAFTFLDPDGNGKDDTVGFGAMLGVPDWHITYQTLKFIHAAGMEGFMDPDGNPIFTGEEGVGVVQEIRDWVYKYKVIPSINWIYSELYAGVKGGTIGIGRCASWNPPSFDEWLDNDYLVFAFPPKTIDQKEPNYQGLSMHTAVMAENCKNKEAAVAYLKHFLSKESQTLFYAEQGLAARTDLNWDELTADNPRKEFFTQELPAKWSSIRLHQATMPYREVLAESLGKIFANPSLDIATELAIAEEEIIQKIKELE